MHMELAEARASAEEEHQQRLDCLAAKNDLLRHGLALSEQAAKEQREEMRHTAKVSNCMHKKKES